MSKTLFKLVGIGILSFFGAAASIQLTDEDMCNAKKALIFVGGWICTMIAWLGVFNVLADDPPIDSERFLQCVALSVLVGTPTGIAAMKKLRLI